MNGLVDAGTTDDSGPTVERLRGAAGDLEAMLEQSYAEYRGELFGYLLRLTHDPDTAEDLIQDGFLRLVREARAGRMPNEVRPWLYRVTTNGAVDRGRRLTRIARLLPRLWERDTSDAPELQALRAERDAEVLDALARLDPRARAALLLAGQGFSGREISDWIGRSESATRTMMCRSRMRLRQLVDPEEARA